MADRATARGSVVLGLFLAAMALVSGAAATSGRVGTRGGLIKEDTDGSPVRTALHLLPSDADSSVTSAGGLKSTSPGHHSERIRGRVVWLDAALKRKYEIASDFRADKTMVALETTSGEVLPIVPDLRGFAFTLDERLRDIDLELFVRRYDTHPYIQIITVFRVRPEGLYELDYWCEICSISMYTLKVCDCCQGPIDWRERLAEPAAKSP